MCNFEEFSENKSEYNDYLKHLEESINFEEFGKEYEVKMSDKSFFYSIPSEDFEFRVIKLYKYEVRSGAPIQSNSRKFCKQLYLRTQNENNYLTFDEVKQLSNKGFGPGGSNEYDILKYRGGLFCRHTWVRYLYDTKSGNIVRDTKQPPQPYPVPKYTK